MGRFVCLMLLLFPSFLLLGQNNMHDMDYEELRINMLTEQIIKRGVKDSLVVQAMEKVKRHLFVPNTLRKFAYHDRPLPIGEGQTISQPYIVAYMTELLNLNSASKVLEIGTGSGFQAAVLAEICSEVHSIEIVKSLQKRASYVLDSLNYNNVYTYYADGYKGLAENSPFDGIIVTCSPGKIPEPLLNQLADGGVMVIPVGEKNIKELVVIKKKNGRISKQKVLPVRFVPMVDEKGRLY